MDEIGKWRQLNEKKWYGAVWDLRFMRWDEMEFEILIQALFKEWDQYFFKFGLNASMIIEWYFSYQLF